MPSVDNYGQLNFRKQVVMLLPPKVRSLSMVDWLHSLVKPLDSILDADWDYMYDQFIKGHLTGQKMVFQAGLNFLFDITVAPFILIETFRNEGVTAYIFNEAELTTTYMFNEADGVPLYMLNEAEAVQPNSVDFVVKMPTIYATADNLDRLAAQVDILKPVSRTYNIITY